MNYLIFSSRQMKYLRHVLCFSSMTSLFILKIFSLRNGISNNINRMWSNNSMRLQILNIYFNINEIKLMKDLHVML